MSCGFGADEYSTHKQMLGRSHRLLTWTPTNCDPRYVTGILECINVRHPPRDRIAWSCHDYDDAVRTAFPSSKQSRFVDTDKHTSMQAAQKKATLETCPSRLHVVRTTDHASPHIKNRVHFTGERVDGTGHNNSLCQLPSPQLTFFNDNTASHSSNMPQVDAQSHTILQSQVMLPASPASSQPEGDWQDQTYDFNMAKICATVRGSEVSPTGVSNAYTWYPEAVAIDALFPPGVPLSLMEICIYYPHHVRWQDLMLRLAHNEYHGVDILGIQVCNCTLNIQAPY